MKSELPTKASVKLPNCCLKVVLLTLTINALLFSYASAIQNLINVVTLTLGFHINKTSNITQI